MAVNVWKKMLWAKVLTIKNWSFKFQNTALFSICLTTTKSEHSQWICKHGKNWWSLCETILSFKRSQSSQYQSRARFYLGKSASLFKAIKYWVSEFKWGCMNYQDEHVSGRPKWNDHTRNSEENSQNGVGWSQIYCSVWVMK